MAQKVKNRPTVRETQARSLDREDPWEKEMATHSSIFVWEIPRTAEPSRLQSMRSQESQTRPSDFCFHTFKQEILRVEERQKEPYCRSICRGAQRTGVSLGLCAAQSGAVVHVLSVSSYSSEKMVKVPSHFHSLWLCKAGAVVHLTRNPSEQQTKPSGASANNNQSPAVTVHILHVHSYIYTIHTYSTYNGTTYEGTTYNIMPVYNRCEYNAILQKGLEHLWIWEFAGCSWNQSLLGIKGWL